MKNKQNIKKIAVVSSCLLLLTSQSVFAEGAFDYRGGAGGGTHSSINTYHSGTNDYHGGTTNTYHSGTDTYRGGTDNIYHSGTNEYHGGNQYGSTNNFRGGSDRFNNDTVNVNHNGGYGGNSWNNNNRDWNNGNAPYHGWNEGPVGFSGGWNSGWSNGNANGGLFTGLAEGLVAGIAGTMLFNAIFDHNSTPPVTYASGGGSGSGGNYYSGGDTPDATPTNITNNTTDTTVIDDGDSNIGYWLLALGVLVFAALGIALLMRRKQVNIHNYREESYYENDGYNGYDRGSNDGAHRLERDDRRRYDTEVGHGSRERSRY